MAAGRRCKRLFLVIQRRYARCESRLVHLARLVACSTGRLSPLQMAGRLLAFTSLTCVLAAQFQTALSSQVRKAAHTLRCTCRVPWRRSCSQRVSWPQVPGLHIRRCFQTRRSSTTCRLVPAAYCRMAAAQVGPGDTAMTDDNGDMLGNMQACLPGLLPDAWDPSLLYACSGSLGSTSW